MPQPSILSFNTIEGFVNDALEYSQYEYWYDFHYKSLEPEFEF